MPDLIDDPVKRAACAAESFAARQESNPGGHDNYWTELVCVILSAVREPGDAAIAAGEALLVRAGMGVFEDRNPPPDVVWPVMIDELIRSGRPLPEVDSNRQAPAP